MSINQIENVFRELTLKTHTYLKAHEDDLVRRAFDFANKAHFDQLRESKDPYITHPIEVAKILAELGLGASVLAAALLHDTLEDCEVTEQDLIDQFGSEIAGLVQGVTNLGKMHFKSREEKQVQNFRKMFIAMAKDIRVLFIKLADRLHNMRTLDYVPLHRKISFSRETMDIFAPLAHRLGMASFKWEMEDLAFYYLQPMEYKKIKRLVSETREERESFVSTLLVQVERYLEQAKIKAHITGRSKHFFSIYRKLSSQDIGFSELLDTYGTRIIVESVEACYGVLGVIHTRFKPVSGRFKDYIAVPKMNGYQSLHTTVIGPKGRPVEIQIRSDAMHQISEHGVAAHWKYKETSQNSKQKQPDPDFSWLRQMVEMQNQEKMATVEFFNNLKLDLFVDEVFVYTPNGDVMVLPKGSSPLDFAYKVHTEVGQHYRGAKVNGTIIPMNYELKNGDRLEILTSKLSYPKTHWLDFIATHHAKTNVKQYLSRKQRKDQYRDGMEKLEQYMASKKWTKKYFFSKQHLEVLKQKFQVKSFDECAYRIALGELSVSAIDACLCPVKLGLTTPIKLPTPLSKRSVKASPILVVGLDSIETTIAKCCSPLPGELIGGYVTKNAGVSIHKVECSNFRYLVKKEQNRVVEVDWNVRQTSGTNVVSIHIVASNRVGVLDEILQKLVELKINMREIFTKVNAAKTLMKSHIQIELKDIKQYHHLAARILEISEVVSVRRQ